MSRVTLSVLLLGVLILSGCQLGGGSRTKDSVRHDQGTIDRTFARSNSYDTKVFTVKHKSDYVFTIRANTEEGTVLIWLTDDHEVIYFELGGSQLNEKVTVSLDEGKHMIGIETQEAVNGSISIEYKNMN